MFCVCVGRGGLPRVMLVYGGRLLCLCTAGMRARCSDSFTRNTGVACLSLYHFDWNTPAPQGQPRSVVAAHAMHAPAGRRGRGAEV